MKNIKRRTKKRISRIIQDRPLAAFFALFASVIQDPSSEDSAKDTQLMHLALENLETFHHSNKMHDYTQKLLLVVSSCCQVATAIIRSRNNDAFPGMTFSDRMDTCEFPVGNDLVDRKDGIDPDIIAPPRPWVGSEQSPLLFSALDLPEEPNDWSPHSADVLDSASSMADRHLHTRAMPSPNGIHLGPVKKDGQLEWQKILGASSTVFPSTDYSNAGQNGKQQPLWSQ